MTDVQEQAKNSTAAKLARLERLCGRFPVLSSENRQDYKRHKVLLMERRFRARLAFQAYREKATQQDKAALDKKLAEQSPGQLILPEEALDGVIADIDAMLRRPAEEPDHARALEVGMVYFEHLDRLLNAAIVRRNAILSDIERYEYLFAPTPILSAVVEEVRQVSDAPQCEAPSQAQGKDVAPPLVTAQDGNS